MGERISRVTPHTEKPRAQERIVISSETKVAAGAVGDMVQGGNAPSEAHIEHLTRSVEQDLSDSGVSLRSEEKQAFESTAKEILTVPEKAPVSDAEAKAFEVALPEYLQYFTQLSKTYGLDKHRLKFGAIEGLILQGRVIRSLSGIGLIGLVSALWDQKGHLPVTSETAWKYLTKALNPNVQIHTPEGPKGVEYRAEDLLDVATELKGQMGRFKWPLIITLSTIPSTIGEVAGGLALVNAMKDVRRAVNDRGSKSLYMRDLEFIHDKSAAEINNIIEKGKQGTVDLFTTTYMDVIPRLAAIGLGTLGQIKINPVGTFLQLARMPFLYGASKAYAREVLKQRAADLKRKDQIDTRINATLGSLEIIKTSDSMEEGIGELKDYMTMRDEFQSTSSKEMLKQQARMEAIDTTLGVAIPAVNAAVDFFRSGGKWGKAVGGAMFGSFGGRLIERNTRELVDTYIDKIQPAIQDIKRMEELLGPYESLDTPDGPKEQRRIPASELPNYDISVRNLSYKDILHNVSLDVPQGAFVTLKGPSGSGKTTLMRHMLGLFTTGEGQVTYGGRDMDGIKKYGSDSVYGAIGYANQNPQYFENMTLKENLLLWTKKDIPEDEIVKVLHDLRLDPIIPRLDSTVKHFSGGEMRRIGIARALLKDPKVLFLDEPTANLDDESTKQVIQIIRDMRASRPDMTVVAVTHDPQFEAIAERVVDLASINRKTELDERQVYYASASSANVK